MTILLDAAGTLIHPIEPVGAVYSRYLVPLGLEVPPNRMEAAFRGTFSSLGDPDFTAHPTGEQAERAWWERCVAETLRSLGGRCASLAEVGTGSGSSFRIYFDALFSHYAAPDAWALFPEVETFLARAARSGPLAVVSNFDSRLHSILDGLGISSAFDLVLTSAEARARKPAPEIFALALRRLDTPPDRAIHCGDNLSADFEGARRAGLRAFHLRRPAHTLLDFLEFCRS